MNDTKWRKRDELDIPDNIYDMVLSTQGRFFEKLTGVDAIKITNDLLDPFKAIGQADVLQEFTSLCKNKKVLEVGSGLGTNIAVWIKKYGVDGYGIEPSGEGFDDSLTIARKIFEINHIGTFRLLGGYGEYLPFMENTFDIVFSANVLEHTGTPEFVIAEGMRVLKPGGVLQIVFPNYHSVFDGHYAIFHPPVFTRWFLPLYVRLIAGRDNSFAKTLNSELNVKWTERLLIALKNDYPFSLLSLGDALFKQRMNAMDIQSWAGLIRVKKLIDIARKIKINNLISCCMVKMKMWTPIILTLKKG